MVKKSILIIAIVGLISFGGGFFAGMKYEENKTPSFTRRFADGQAPRVMSGNNLRAGVRPFAGEIIASDEETITVKLPDGSSKIVILSKDTKISKTEEGSKDDLKTGEKITVFGEENSDGSITAQNIQLIW